jgi:hypothetical protein
LVHRQKIATFSNLLAMERDPRKRSTLARLVIDAEDQFGIGLKQLAVAEKLLAYGHHHIMVVRRLIDYLNANRDDALSQGAEFLYGATGDRYRCRRRFSALLVARKCNSRIS